MWKQNLQDLYNSDFLFCFSCVGTPGWESQLLETGFLGIFLCPLWTLSRLPRHTPPSGIVIWGFRWLIFRIMLGAVSGPLRFCFSEVTARGASHPGRAPTLVPHVGVLWCGTSAGHEEGASSRKRALQLLIGVDVKEDKPRSKDMLIWWCCSCAWLLQRNRSEV